VFALLADREQTNLLLIRRADRGDAWSSHIAFPGGHLEPVDAGPLEAAYRETYEELGIRRDAITRLGDLGHFETGNARVDVHAFVGLWSTAEPLQPNPVEVAQTIEVPLAWLLQQHEQLGFTSTPAEDLGKWLAYPLADTEIWGVTARIVHFLLELIARSPTAVHPDPSRQ
jgi:8-oxo-dGTP pyrophosphatase MutT (NUDIX family)